MFRKPYMTLAAAVTLLLLAIAPVYAAPSLNLGSQASYDLKGRLQVDQSCTTDNLAYAAQACNGFSSITISTVPVGIYDNGTCPSSADLACNFSPSIVNLIQGGMVVWTNYGRLMHDVKSNTAANGGLPSFAGNLSMGSSFQVVFSQPGTYQYYDLLYNWMKGTILVTAPPPPPPPPMPTSNHVDLNGNVNWTVVGLSSDRVNLNVTHHIGITVLVFTPVTESGSFEQSINLSTRVESPGTATSIVRSLLTSLLTALTQNRFATGASTLGVQTMLSAQSSSPDFTMWWVNGPLSNGSPVQILHGWSSVTGSEDLNLGPTIGTRSAWIVTSQISQTVNTNIPNPNNPFSQPSTSKTSADLKLLWSYDKSADLLLRNDNMISLTTHSVTPTIIYTSCGPSGCTQVPVTVTRDMALTINLALHLASTSLSLPHPSQVSTLMSLLSTVPWMLLGIGGLATAIAVALIVWLARRTKATSMLGHVPTTGPAAPT